MGSDGWQGTAFHGAKAAILIGDRLLVTLRDDFDWIAFPGHWDLPGGGREGTESPRETVARETMEEVSLDLSRADWLWEGAFPSATRPGTESWFFVVRLPPGAEAEVALGDEGQDWRLVEPEAFLGMEGAVPFLQERLKVGLAGLARAAAGP